MHPTVQHPEPERLLAYGLGRLPPEQAPGLEVHVAECASCCAALAGVPDDHLVALFRPAAETLPWLSTPSRAAEVPSYPEALRDHPRYRLLHVLGSGGMGTVYRAEHRLMNRPVALKVLRQELLTHPAARERFFREVQTVSRLAHPHVVSVYDAEEAGGVCFLVMEYVPGTDLAALVARSGPLPVPRACAYVRQAALGLQHAHERGLVHRDIKPANLMLTPDGTVKVLDFGLSRLSLGQTDHLTASGILLGTPGFMAPEQAVDPRAADIRSDIYSLGRTLCFLLTGQVGTYPPDSVDTVSTAGQRPAQMPAALAPVLERMLAREPERRYQTPAQVAAALEPFAAGVPAGPPPGRSRKVRLVVCMAGGVLAVVLAVALALILRALPLANEERRALATPQDGRGVVAGDETAAARAGQPRLLHRWHAHGRKVSSLAVAGDGKQFLSGSFGELTLWRVDADREVKTFPNIMGWVEALAISPDGTRALSGGQDRTVHLWELATATELDRLEQTVDPVKGVAFAPDGKGFLFTTRQGMGRLCTLQKLKEGPRFRGVHAAFTAGGGLIVSSDERVLYRWNAENAEERGHWAGPISLIGTLAVSDNGKVVVTADPSTPGGQAYVFESTSRDWRTLTGHKGGVGAAAVSGNGERILTGDRTGTLRLWQARTGKELRRWEGHPAGPLNGPVVPDGVTVVVFLPDGKRALTGGGDGSVALWQLGK
jgi:WD40 repeat protein